MSIQRYLVLLIIAIVTLATFGAALHGYRASQSELEKILDQELVTLSYSIATINSSSKVIKQKSQARLAFQVWQDKHLVFRTDNSPESALSDFTLGFSVKNFLGQRWRVYSAQIDERWVFVAQPQSQRISSAESVLVTSITPIVFSIPVIGVFVLLAVRRSLSPLRNLSTQLKQKSSDDLEPISLTFNSKELEPIVNTINSVLARLKLAFTREKRIASDTAHELRTPISVLNIAAHNLKSSFQTNTLTHNDFIELSQSVERIAHVVEQILALNRTSPESFTKQFTAINLETVLQNVIGKFYNRIEAQHQTISLEAKEYWVLGDEFSLQTLFENLVSNANKYAGEHSEIRIQVSAQQAGILVVVEDSGIGVVQSDREKIFDRFYRIDNPSSNKSIIGCGLGLSIVKHIVELHSADIRLEQSSLGGLKVAVLFSKDKPLATHDSHEKTAHLPLRKASMFQNKEDVNS